MGLPCVASDHGHDGSGLVPLGLCEVHPQRQARVLLCPGPAESLASSSSCQTLSLISGAPSIVLDH